MQYHAFLIKYAEIGTKGKNRYMFEDALMKQIRYALKNVDGQFDVTKEAGRIYVNAEGSYDYEDAVEALKRVLSPTWIRCIRTRTLPLRWMRGGWISSILWDPSR